MRKWRQEVEGGDIANMEIDVLCIPPEIRFFFFYMYDEWYEQHQQKEEENPVRDFSHHRGCDMMVYLIVYNLTKSCLMK